MPQITFANRKQRQKVIQLKDTNQALQITMEMLVPVQQRMQTVQAQMRETLELLGVPTDGRFVQINDGSDNPALAGVWYEDENVRFDAQAEKWVERTEAERAEFLKRFPAKP